MADAEEIDHVDLNGLDCRRQNLRAATSSQNKHNIGKRRTNTSGAKGVYWNKVLGQWFAQITVEGRKTHLGCFGDDKARAAEAYARAAREMVGEFARTT